jgi:hypothetical protein
MCKHILSGHDGVKDGMVSGLDPMLVQLLKLSEIIIIFAISSKEKLTFQ